MGIKGLGNTLVKGLILAPFPPAIKTIGRLCLNFFNLFFLFKLKILINFLFLF